VTESPFGPRRRSRSASRVLLALTAPLALTTFAAAQAGDPAEPAPPGDGPSGEVEPAVDGEDAQAPDRQTPRRQAPGDRASARGSQPRMDLSTMVVTPTSSDATILDVPYTVYRVDQERIEFLRTTPQALRDIPGVMVQETGTGQGSPFIRGFTSFRTLYLIDGIRLNNSTFREGPNQYSGTIDPLSLSGIEVVKGPSSVLYGSDAIGGTINVFTKDPTITDRAIGGRLFTRVASGANYNIQRSELGGAIAGNTYWHAGVTRKDFGDMEAGDPSGTLPQTGYDEWDGDAKVIHALDETSRLTWAFQRVDLEDAPRTHRTVNAVPFEGSTVGSDLRRDFDQRRTLTYLRYDENPLETGAWSKQYTLSYQRHEETRQRVRSNGDYEEQGFDVGTVGLLAKASRDLDFGRFTVGAEWYRDTVDSFLNRFANQTPANDVQGPVGDDSTYDLAGAYADLAVDVTDTTTVTAGARLTYARAKSNEVLDPVTQTDQIGIEDDWTALTGSVRFEERLIEDERGTVALFGGVSEGFRAPTLSDLTRFDSARTNEFEIPAPGLDPERFIAYELGIKHQTERMSIQLAGFLTEGDNVIQRILTGNTVGGENEVTKQNVGVQRIGGVELGASYDWTEEWTTFGTFAWLDGEQDTIEVVGGPTIETVPSRLQPLTTMVGTRFSPVDQDWYAELRWIHAEDADRLAPNDEGDTSRIPPGGTPGYDILNLFGRYDLNADTSFFVGLENITDEDYRVHGSGQNRPGRNLVFGASWAF